MKNQTYYNRREGVAITKQKLAKGLTKLAADQNTKSLRVSRMMFNLCADSGVLRNVHVKNKTFKAKFQDIEVMTA